MPMAAVARAKMARASNCLPGAHLLWVHPNLFPAAWNFTGLRVFGRNQDSSFLVSSIVSAIDSTTSSLVAAQP